MIQRVAGASVTVDNALAGEIGKGILVLLGVEAADTQADGTRLLDKIVNYRIFPDPQGKMNVSLKTLGGELLVVSQFTLVADTQKGLRPGFSRGAAPAVGRQRYEEFCAYASAQGIRLQTGVFGADMQVSLVNDGPVTFVLRS